MGKTGISISEEIINTAFELVHRNFVQLCAKENEQHESLFLKGAMYGSLETVKLICDVLCIDVPAVFEEPKGGDENVTSK